MADRELTREIDEGPAGSQNGAFFDLDGTLLAGFSSFEFLRDALARGRMGIGELGDVLRTTFQFQTRQIGFSAFVAGTASTLKGRPEAEMVEVGERLFKQRLATALYPEARALVKAHLKKEHTVAVVSAATRYQIDPIARELGIAHILCTALEVADRCFTGEVVHPTCYGEGKAIAVRRFARGHRVQRKLSYFYTDSEEDLPLLEIVGRPRPLNPTSRLAAIAARRGWPTRRFTSRGRPGWRDIARTGLALGSLMPSMLLGAPAGLLDRNRRRAMNVALSTWGEVGTALAGIELQIDGEENLWSHRPAVFIFNHQSGIDPLLLCKLLRRDIVGVAKAELKANPIFGPVFALGGAVFIDRYDREKAIQALAPAVQALREGMSVVIAPEGTRSTTPRIGRFKKGAFHIAMAAGVPIVPIVFRNALDALPKHSLIVRPATIEVVVQPPIPTRDWSHETLEQHIAAVERLYVDTLRQ